MPLYTDVDKLQCPYIHDTNIEWFCCDMCKFKCKRGSALKSHLANIHDINVEWFCCNKCKYKCKQKRYNLTRHRKNKHGVAVSEKEPDNISKTNAPDKDTEILQNTKTSSQGRHQHYSRNAIQRKFRKHKKH